MGLRMYDRPPGYRPPVGAAEFTERIHRGERFFEGAQLDEAVIPEGAPYTDLNLAGAHLSHADLRRASFHGVDFTRADLSGAYLDRAQLAFCSFGRADLSRTWWRMTSIAFLDFFAADLTDARGLEMIVARPPDRARLDEVAGSGPGCFVSYPGTEPLAEEVADVLRAADIPRWFAPRSSSFSTAVEERLARVIDTCDVFVLVHTHAALERRYVRSEVSSAAHVQDGGQQLRVVVLRGDDASLPTAGPLARLRIDHVLDCRPPTRRQSLDQLLAFIRRPP